MCVFVTDLADFWPSPPPPLVQLAYRRLVRWINGNLLTIGSWFNGRYGLSIGEWLSLASARIGGVDLCQAGIGHMGSTEQALGAQ